LSAGETHEHGDELQLQKSDTTRRCDA